MEKLREYLFEHKTTLILITSIVLVFAAAATAVFVLRRIENTGAALSAPESSSVTDHENDDADRSAVNGSGNDSDMNADDDDDDDPEEDIRESSGVFVCVPLDKMSLRSTPGSTSDNVASMYAGEKVKWDGEYKTINGNTYYKVKLSDGTEGYALAGYLIPVYYENDDKALDIVETYNALYTYKMMETDIDKLTQKYPECLADRVFGKSVDGRDIHCLLLGNKDAKHRIFAQASIHGREYMNTQLVMKLVEYYCHEYKRGLINGRSYEELFENVCICVIPMSNPDGVTIAQFGGDEINDPDLKKKPQQFYEQDRDYMLAAVDEYGDSFWVDHYMEDDFDISLYSSEYIGYEEYLKQWKSNARGVDLNKNFDGNWEGVQAKSSPSYTDYKGESVLSEPEAAALADLATETDYDMYISYHSKGEIIYYDTDGNLPEVSRGSLELAKLASSQIKYNISSTKTAANVNQGGFGDWVQLGLGKPSITIESGRHRCPLAIGEFKPMWYRHRELWAVLMDNILTEDK